MHDNLVLSLFPGADLFGMAFEQEGWCVVRGPDVLLGGDITQFHAPRDVFAGVIGGPPCKMFSKALMGAIALEGDLLPELERVIDEAQPQWWLSENVPGSPQVRGAEWNVVLDAWEYGARQHRKRRFCSNLELDMRPQCVPVELRHSSPMPTVLASEWRVGRKSMDPRRASRYVGRRFSLPEMNEAMGLPDDWETPALLQSVAYEVRGNGVPLQMGRALARAIRAHV